MIDPMWYLPPDKWKEVYRAAVEEQKRAQKQASEGKSDAILTNVEYEDITERKAITDERQPD